LTTADIAPGRLSSVHGCQHPLRQGTLCRSVGIGHRRPNARVGHHIRLNAEAFSFDVAGICDTTYASMGRNFALGVDDGYLTYFTLRVSGQKPVKRLTRRFPCL
jgi:hypothetical protein